MIKLIYDKGNCVGCPPGMGCMGRDCPQCWETKMTCDICGYECDELWKVDGDADGRGEGDYCEDCFDEYIREHYVHVSRDNAGDFIDEHND